MCSLSLPQQLQNAPSPKTTKSDILFQQYHQSHHGNILQALHILRKFLEVNKTPFQILPDSKTAHCET